MGAWVCFAFTWKVVLSCCLQQQTVLSSQLHALCFKGLKIEWEGLVELWGGMALPCTCALCKGKAACVELCLTRQHHCLQRALDALWMPFTGWCVTSKAPLDLGEHPADSQTHLSSPSRFRCVQLESHCLSGRIAHVFSLAGSLLRCLTSCRIQWLNSYSSWLNLGPPPLEVISNKVLPPCRDERDKGGCRNSQTCRIKGYISSQQNIFKLRHNPRKKTKVTAWPSGICYDLWLVKCSPFKSLHLHTYFRLKSPKVVPQRPDKFKAPVSKSKERSKSGKRLWVCYWPTELPGIKLVK